MQPRHLVVIGASAGGIEALRELVAGLPRDFSAAIAIVLHSSPQSPSVLADLLSRAGPLDAILPSDRARLHGGTIYVAPPDFHLVIEPGHVRVAKGPKENRFRPAIDPLFRSAAQVYGPHAIGVVLSGNLDDGAAGLWTIKQLGGVAVVQHPGDAMFPSMPESALDYVKADHVVPLSEIPPLLVELTDRAARDVAFQVPERVEVEVKIAKQEDPLQAGVKELGDRGLPSVGRLGHAARPRTGTAAAGGYAAADGHVRGHAGQREVAPEHGDERARRANELVTRVPHPRFERVEAARCYGPDPHLESPAASFDGRAPLRRERQPPVAARH